MALIELEVNTSLLASDRTTMEENLNQVQNTLNGIYTEIEELNAMWSGPANEAFRSTFGQDQARITEIVNSLKKFLEQLEETQHKYEECESSVAEIVAAVRI